MSSAKIVEIQQRPLFQKAIKKLHTQAKRDLDEALAKLVEDPTLGQSKVGDLAGTRVYKFRILNQQVLLAYIYDEHAGIILLEALGSHQNFYRDLKRD